MMFYFGLFITLGLIVFLLLKDSQQRRRPHRLNRHSSNTSGDYSGSDNEGGSCGSDSGCDGGGGSD
jgi:uncharacterized membrane protein